MSKITNIGATMLTTESMTTFVKYIALQVWELSGREPRHPLVANLFRAELRKVFVDHLEEIAQKEHLNDADKNSLSSLHESLELVFDHLDS